MIHYIGRLSWLKFSHVLTFCYVVSILNSGITIPWMSAGYEIEISPLQMLAFYNAIANGGKFANKISIQWI